MAIINQRPTTNDQRPLSSIKLVIWDLDETFWKGTLSEGHIEPLQENINLVRLLTRKGIVNSICSKNDDESAKKELIRLSNIWELFVFPSINWNPKGQRTAELIHSMGLRAENVLFIDDNPGNIEEVKYYLPDIQTLDPSDISTLYKYAEHLEDESVPNKRLNQYKILEAKTKAHASVSSNEEFLRQSDIKIFIGHDCIKYISRITELVGRTNQLNYTKNRMNESEILNLLNDSEYDSAVISAEDKYGDYGIIGFYCMDRSEHRLIHFLFSCRTLGMGIEQYVYELLNFPVLDVKGETAVKLVDDNIADWITLEENKSVNDSENDNGRKILKRDIFIKGPCDASAIPPYFKTGEKARIDTEFNYPDDNGVIIAGHHITAMIRQSMTLKDEDILRITNDSGFYSPENFRTRFFDESHKVIVYSLLPDCQEGIYIHKATGIKIGFSSGNHSLCDPCNWDNFKSGVYTNHNVAFTDDILERFRSNFSFSGFMNPHETAENILYIRENLPEDCLLILMLGSEIECPDSDTNFTGLHVNHKAVNDELCKLFRSSSSVKLINVTEHIRSAGDYHGHIIDHYNRRIYYELAQEIIHAINEHKHIHRIKGKSLIEIFSRRIARRIMNSEMTERIKKFLHCRK